jgi:hypothetical protein
MPMGVGSKKAFLPELVIMLQSVRDAKQLIAELEAKHIRFNDKKILLHELSTIR